MKIIKLTNAQAFWLWHFLYYGTDGMFEKSKKDRVICDRITDKIRVQGM